MENTFKIKEEYIKHFERMIRHIEEDGRTDLCPIWFNSLIDKGDATDDCYVCQEYFRRLDKGVRSEFAILVDGGSVPLKDNCPCDHYSKRYLIEFLNKVITNSK